jgi:hypothetical protein
MNNLERASLFEEIKSLIDDIDSLMVEHGFDPDEFDPDDSSDDEIHRMYSLIHQLKESVE